MFKRVLLGAFAALTLVSIVPAPAKADPPWARRGYDHRGWERDRWRRHEHYERGYYRPPPPVYYAPPRPYYPPPGIYIPFR